MKLLEKSASIFDRIISILAFMAAIIIIFTTLIVGTDTILRYFLHQPLVWVFETTEYLLLYMTFLGAAWVLKKDGHVRVDILLNQLNQKTRIIFGIITSIIGIVICGVLALYGAQVTWDYFVRNVEATKSLLDFPYAPVLAIIPVGSFLLLLQFVRNTYGYVENWRALAKQ